MKQLVEEVNIFDDGSFSIDGVIHWVTSTGILIETDTENADGVLVGKPALKNPQVKDPKDIVLKQGDRIDRTGRVQRKLQGIAYPVEIRERARVLLIEKEFDWKKVQDALKEEFGLKRIPSKQTLYVWCRKMRMQLLKDGLLPKAMKAQFLILDQDKDLKTLQRAVEYVHDRVDGKPVQPVDQVVGTYDLTHVLDMGTDEKPEEDKKKTPDHEWT